MQPKPLYHFLCVFLMAALSLQAAVISIEAESLPDLGQWKQQGSFLLSNIKGAKAQGTFQAAAEAKMNVWVLAMTHGGNWRKGTLILNGQKIMTFGDEPLTGAEQPGFFHWVKSPSPVSIPAGKNRIALQANSAVTRVDRILLTDDLDYVPGKTAKLSPLPAETAPAYIHVEAARLVEQGAWQNQGDFLLSGKSGVKAGGTFQSPARQTVVVWVKAMTFGGNFRKTDILINGIPAGMAGDEPLAPGQKAGWHWVRLPSPVPLQQGTNTIELTATSDFSRIGTIFLANTEEFRPESVKITNFYDEGKKVEGIFRRPKSTNPGGPRILAMVGGRPWVGNSFSTMLDKAGCNVQLLNSCYLAGQGGAPIRNLLYKKDEPTPLDGISYEFQNLRPYKAIIVTGIPAKNQENIFTPERVAALRRYVENGGKLLLTSNVPASLDELLPVKLGSFEKPEHQTACRPEGKNFALLPESWEIFDPFRAATIKEGARILSRILSPSGKNYGIYAASMKIGKGEVMFLNANYERLQNTYQFFTWVYHNCFFAGAVSELLGQPLQLEKTLIQGLDVDAPATLETADVRLELPGWKLTDNSQPALIRENSIVFPNGCRIVVKSDNTLDFFYPNQAAPFITAVQPPMLRYTREAVIVEAATAEATDIKEETREYQANWKVSELQGGAIPAIIWQSEKGDIIRQEFKSGELELDGVHYDGIASRASVLKSDLMIAALHFAMKMDTKGGKARRFSCYQSPRGYKEYPLDGSEKVDTKTWGFFASGQPFAWLEGSNAVYAGFISSPVNTGVEFRMEKGDAMVQGVVKISVGYRKALPEQPVETPFYWHMVSQGTKAANNNGWMAMFQFQRHNLREVVGFPEIPARPTATYLNTCTDVQRDAIIEKMGKAGFTFCYMPFCPSQMVAMATPERKELYGKVVAAGMRAFPWTPCGHTMGQPSEFTKEEVDKWWARTLDGKIYSYFGGNYPVVDQHNPQYRQWYLERLNKEIDYGAGTYWFDMGGTAAGTVNYAKPNSGTGLDAVIDIYRVMFNRGQCAVTEGENPLAIDGFIYRRTQYTPMKGKEYLLLGTMPENDVIGFVFDYFRLSMFDCFMYVPFDDYGMNFERYPGEQKQLAKIVHYLPAIQKSLDVTGMPFIRETPFGTTWISEKGGALYFYNGVKKLNVALPKGYVPVSMTTPTETIDLNGEMPKSVPDETIVIFQKVQ